MQSYTPKSLTYQGADLTSCSITWALNRLPEATISFCYSPSEAVPQGGGSIMLDNTILFTGDISASAITKRTAITGSMIRPTASVRHKAAVLENIQALSYHYMSPQLVVSPGGFLVESKLVPTDILNNGVISRNNVCFLPAAVLAKYETAQQVDVVAALLDMTQGFIDSLLKADSSASSTLKVRDYVGGSAILTDSVRMSGGSPALKYMSEVYTQQAMQGNVWTVLQTFARVYGLFIIPGRNGIMTLCPAQAWSKSVSATVPSSIILGITYKKDTEARRNSPDGVVVLMDTDNKTHTVGVTYPKNIDASKGVTNRRILTTTLPPWLNPREFMVVGSDTSKSKNNQKISESSGDKKSSTTKADDAAYAAAQLYAQSVFAAACNGGEQIVIDVVWNNLSYIDHIGRIIKVVISDKSSGAMVYYGMLSAVQLNITSSPFGSAANMQLTLSHVRNETEQSNHGMSTHPLYK